VDEEADAGGELKRVYRQLRNHTGGDTPEATFRRLVGKQAEARFIAPASGPLVVREEVWTAEQLEPLWGGVSPGEPYDADEPVVVFRVGGVDMLIDGHNRRAKRLREGGTQRVLLVEPAGKGAR